MKDVKLWNRALSLLVTSVFVIGSLAACGQKQAEVSSGESDKASVPSTKETVQEVESTESVETVDPLGKYEETITLTSGYIVDSTFVFDENIPEMKSIEENIWTQLYLDNLNINVDYSWVVPDSSSYATKWNLAMAQSDLPDFGVVDQTTYKMLLDAGLIMDMTDIFEQYASETYKEFAWADGGSIISALTHDGKMMGLPLTGAQPDDICNLLIRKDWLEDLNMEAPTTLEGLYELAKAFVEEKGATYGIGVRKQAYGQAMGVRGILNGFGAYVDMWTEDGNGNLVYSGVQDTNKDALLYLQKLYTEGLINEDFAVAETNMVSEDIVAGKCGIVYGTYALPTGVNKTKGIDPDSDWVVVELPTADGTPGVTQGNAFPSQFMFVSKDCEHPEAVVKLINQEIAVMYEWDAEDSMPYQSPVVKINGEDKTVQVHKYRATRIGCSKPWTNLTRHLEAVAALETGKKEFSLALSETTYNNLVNYYENNDTAQHGTSLIYGYDGTYSVVNKMWNENRILVNAYQTLKTDTMVEKQALLNEALQTAMTRVIMGEDISLYEKAVEDWYKNGGQAMTDEANAWYSSK